MIRLHAHPFPPSVSKLSLFCSLSVWPLVELTDRRGGRAWSRIIRAEESLVLYKSFNTLLCERTRSFSEKYCIQSVTVNMFPNWVSNPQIDGSNLFTIEIIQSWQLRLNFLRNGFYPLLVLANLHVKFSTSNFSLPTILTNDDIRGGILEPVEWGSRHLFCTFIYLFLAFYYFS